MKKKLYSIAMIAAFFLALSSHAFAQKSSDKAAGQSMVGKVKVNLVTPDNMQRVDGRNAKADAYIKNLEPKFKLKVLAIYAAPDEWDNFVIAASSGKPTTIPHYAMICVPSKMDKKSFTSRAVRQEFKRYANWFSGAANNRPMAALLTSQGNKKLKEYMGVDIGFKFKTGKETKKISETSNSISFGAEVDFNVFKKPSNVYLAVTSIQVMDKMIFLAYFENINNAGSILDIQSKAITWRTEVSSANPGR